MRVSKLTAVAACVAGALGCDPSVTSVGAWEPVVVVPPASVYFEAESGELSGGYVVTTSAAASGGQIIEPPLVENADQRPCNGVCTEPERCGACTPCVCPDNFAAGEGVCEGATMLQKCLQRS